MFGKWLRARRLALRSRMTSALTQASFQTRAAVLQNHRLKSVGVEAMAKVAECRGLASAKPAHRFENVKRGASRTCNKRHARPRTWWQ